MAYEVDSMSFMVCFSGTRVSAYNKEYKFPETLGESTLKIWQSRRAAVAEKKVVCQQTRNGTNEKIWRDDVGNSIR